VIFILYICFIQYMFHMDPWTTFREPEGSMRLNEMKYIVF